MDSDFWLGLAVVLPIALALGWWKREAVAGFWADIMRLPVWSKAILLGLVAVGVIAIVTT